MTNTTTSSNQFGSSFDPLEIEKRLKALVGSSTHQQEKVESDDDVDFVHQFLSDESLDYAETRTASEVDGIEYCTIVQLFRIHVLPNQSRLVIHPSFRPDLPSPPVIEASCIDREARMRVTHKETFGARLEINLSSPEPTNSFCCIEVVSTANRAKATDQT